MPSLLGNLGYALVVLSFGAFVTCIPVTPTGDEVVFTNCSLVDGNGGSVIPGATVTIQGRLITGVHQGPDASLSTAATMIDCDGRFIMPGLIDTHVHVSSETQNYTAVVAELRAALFGGLTSVRDMGGDTMFAAPLAEAASNLAIPSPELYLSALMGGPPFFEDPRMTYVSHGFSQGNVPWLRQVTGDEDLDVLTRQTLDIGEKAIKIYADLEAPAVAKLAAAAHANGLKVWGHAAVFPSKPSENIRAGMDVLSHAAYLVWEPADPMPDNYTVRKDGDFEHVPYDSQNITALLQMFKDQGRILDATLWVFSIDDATAAFEWACNVTRLAHSMGVQISSGTDDMMPDPTTSLLPNLHQELHALVHCAGFSPLEAISAATSVAAQVLDLKDHKGTIAPGKDADMLLLSAGADPTLDIADLRRIDAVVKGGVVWDTKTGGRLYGDASADRATAGAGAASHHSSAHSHARSTPVFPPPSLPTQFAVRETFTQPNGLPSRTVTRWFDAAQQAERLDGWLGTNASTVYRYDTGFEYHHQSDRKCVVTPIFQGAVPDPFPWTAYEGRTAYEGEVLVDSVLCNVWNVSTGRGQGVEYSSTVAQPHLPVRMLLWARDGAVLLQEFSWKQFVLGPVDAHVFQPPCQER